MAYSKILEVSVTPTITAGLYSANDVVGGLLSFTIGYPYGIVRAAQIIDDSGQNAAATLYLFTASPNAIADNAAYAPNDASWLLLAGSTAFSSYDALTDIAQTAPNIYYNLSVAVLYGYLVTTGTPTYTAVDDIHVKLLIEAA